ncbi:TAXI family TRAP transporter solute-binding subunit, partial [Acetomicrobium sp. S15 = DSM 107314]|uniref:TAXI family TRAP transporter solute-binding subunit n=1 Tax=Acetomicrobium sp. S15 = DSM 107314 TaxID=2529858 RepID=UPI00237C807B
MNRLPFPEQVQGHLDLLHLARSFWRGVFPSCSLGDVDLALVQNDIADYAWNGTEFFKKPIKNFRAIARLYPE